MDGINIEMIGKMIAAIRGALAILKDFRGLLPDGKRREDLDHGLADAEAKISYFEQEAAQKLGVRFCLSHDPAVKMLEDREKRFLFHCPQCGKSINVGSASVSADPPCRKRPSDFIYGR
jgi:predicted RNA-binding Zn-ribbon protein involved in translation (DUF1610 family)